MSERRPGFLKGGGASPTNLLELFLPSRSGCCSGLINDEDLNVRRGSVFRILFAVEGEVCADIAETSDPLPPFAKARMVKAHRLADDRNQASAVLQSPQGAGYVPRSVNWVCAFDSAAAGAKRRIH